MILKPFMREGLMPLPVTFISTISRKGMHFRTLQDLGVSETFSAMFPDGKGPFEKKYEP